MKKALVLAGGGTKGIYQVGVLRALQLLGKDDYNLVIGVSVGALNATMLVQKDFKEMEKMYDNLEAKQIVNGYIPTSFSLSDILNERDKFVPTLQNYVKEKGIDISPFYEMVDRYYNPHRFFASDIDFGCVTATRKDHAGVLVTKEMMKENGRDWLVASASAYPAFPIKVVDGNEYVDGGYYDNFPIDYALQCGAEEIIGIEMNETPLHPLYLNHSSITYIHPHLPLYEFLSFDHDEMQRAKVYGFNDTMKVYGKFCGERYTFHPFIIPSFFTKTMRAILMLETEVLHASNVNERLHRTQMITDKLKEQLHVETIKEEQYFYGLLDSIMEMIGKDDVYVYSYPKMKDEILAFFAPCAYEDFPYKPSLNPQELLNYFTNLDRTNIVKILVHQKLYPTHRIVSRKLALSFYPMECALAEFLVEMMKDIGE